MARFSVRAAGANLSKLIDAALEGEEVIIVRDDVPVVRLIPIVRPGKRRFGALRGRIKVDAGFDQTLPKNELDGWALA